jgi:hypothetical protein
LIIDEVFSGADIFLAWSGATRQGCAGQYSNCFGNESRLMSTEIKIYSTATDGNCLAFFVGTVDASRKTLPCKTKLRLLCSGKVDFNLQKVCKIVNLEKKLNAYIFS